jgi:hypothetical protein
VEKFRKLKQQNRHIKPISEFSSLFLSVMVLVIIDEEASLPFMNK